MPRTPNRSKNKEASGNYTSRHIDGEDIIHHRGTETSAYQDTYVVSAVPIGREPSGLTEPSRQQQYHQQRRPTPEQHQNYNNQRQNSDDDWEQYERHKWDDNPQSSEPPPRQQFTDLPGPHGTSGQTTPRRMDRNQFKDLIKEGYSTGLVHALNENSSRYDFRFWVVDNSGSMQIGDGHRLVKKDGKQKAIACTRWEEIKETVKYHAKMAQTLSCPTIFQLLNDPGLRTTPQRFSVCEQLGKYTTKEEADHCAQQEVSKAMEIMRKISPTGVTPLTQHIWAIEEHIAGMAHELRKSGKLVAIILATDGMPTDELGYGGDDVTNEFIRALRSLEGLPVWTVIRLCTDEDAVKNFYNSLDEQLEISLEVLDDYKGEAREVYKQNPWITYGLPLHRCRNWVIMIGFLI